MIIAASPPGLPRRSMTMPSARAELVDRLLKLRIDGRHPDVEPDDAGGLPPAASLPSRSRRARTSSAGLPTVTGCPCSVGARRDAWTGRSPAPSSNVTSTVDPGRPAQARLRDAPRLDVRQALAVRPRASLAARSRDRLQHRSLDQSRQPGRTRRPPHRDRRCVTTQIAADEPHVEARVAADVARRVAMRRSSTPPPTESARSATGRAGRACRG